jgi:hypothetical protein
LNAPCAKRASPAIKIATALRSSSVRLILVALLGACDCILSAQQGWRDPSRHDVRVVTVDSGVQLEVLDWGGSGPTVVFLTGSGHTAHVYDDLPRS